LEAQKSHLQFQYDSDSKAKEMQFVSEVKSLQDLLNAAELEKSNLKQEILNTRSASLINESEKVNEIMKKYEDATNAEKNLRNIVEDLKVVVMEKEAEVEALKRDLKGGREELEKEADGLRTDVEVLKGQVANEKAQSDERASKVEVSGGDFGVGFVDAILGFCDDHAGILGSSS
jgi:predicted RNase H-like nuclease (RuvC/YqgF family)